MGIRVNQGQTPVPLEQPKAAGQPHATNAAKKAKAGHLAGENLNVERQRGGKPVKAGQQGIPKPALNAPNQDPTVASYQAAMGSMDQLVANMQGDLLAGDLSDLADALEEAAEEGGDGGGAEGGVVIGKKGAKSRLRRINVLAQDVKLKNTSQEQAKDFSSQLKELGRQVAGNPHSSEQLKDSFDKLQNSLKSGEMDGKDLKKMLATMQGQAQKAEKGNGQASIMQQLQNAGKPAHAMAGGHNVGNVGFSDTAAGFKGTVDGKPFNADLANKTLSFEAQGKNVELKIGENGTIKSTANGIPFDMGDNEVATMNHFFMLMALFHEMGTEQRQMSRQGRNMANKAVVEKIKQQAQEQRSAAAAKLIAGTVSGAVKITSASLTMVGSMKGMKADQAAAQAGSSAHPGDMIAQQWNAMGKMFEGLGEAGSSAVQYKAALHEARSTELRAEEEQARFIKQTEQDQMQVAQELSSKARDTFAQTWNQYLQTQQNITRNI